MLYFAFSVLFVASTAWANVVIESPDTVPRNEWTELSRADSNDKIVLAFAVKQSNTDKLIDTLMAVSTPSSDRYGQWLSKNEVFDLVAPPRENVNMVKRWISGPVPDAQIVELTPNGDTLTFETSVGYAENLLNCEYWVYENKAHPDIRVTRVKMGTFYAVPSQVSGFLDFVSPTYRFPALRGAIRSEAAPEATRVTPTFLRELYNVGDAHGMATNNTQGIASFQLQYYSMDDLEQFWETYDITPCDVTNVPSDQRSGHALEAELDTQYITAMGEGIRMQAWYTSGNFYDALLEFTTDLLTVDNPPLVMSVSYGDVETNYGLDYVTRLNNNLAMVGVRGISVLFASGDSGAGGGCLFNSAFQPDYPAASPYVTAVGGVHGGTAGQQPVGESVWVDGGGGFSNYAGRPSYQTDAVNEYLNNANGLPSSSQYNSSGRGFPDIAAQSVDFVIVADGREEAVSGTSCSSPTSAGIFALLNDLRAQNGMASMGFLNPFIYETAAADSTAFNDCTDGNNAGCGLEAGFPAATGWDAASGYGSPDYEVLSGYVLKTGLKTKKHRF